MKISYRYLIRIFGFLFFTLLGIHNAEAQEIQLKYTKAEIDSIWNAQPNFHIPEYSQNDQIIHHSAFSLSYNEIHEQANWMGYTLTDKNLAYGFERESDFLPDPLVKTGTSDDIDFQNSGFDRGHLAPAADMAWSSKSMHESFYYSNISPQWPAFNRGVWKKSEMMVRHWAMKYSKIYVVTGPVLVDGLEKIGVNRVSIPNAFYKVVLFRKNSQLLAVAFLIPHEASKMSIKYFSVPVDSVEKITGINFFSQLPNDIEDLIESKNNLKQDIWVTSTDSNNQNSDSDSKPIQSKTCNAQTKTGKPCQNKTTHSSGRCHLHRSPR